MNSRQKTPPPAQFIDLRTPKPANWRISSADEFKLDKSNLFARGGNLVFGDWDGLQKLVDFYENNPDGIRVWESLRNWTAGILNEWYFPPISFWRYIYNTFALGELGIVYTLTGHELLGSFIRSHVLQIAKLPEEFWLHHELRNYKPEHPLGMIETAQIARALASVLSGAGDLFSPAELTEINTALLEKAVIPMRNYLGSTSAVNNFLGIVAAGTYVAGKYLQDQYAISAGKTTLLRYLGGSIEHDGSYGEGTGYFGYPMNVISYAVAAMNPEERKELFKLSGILHSAEWLAYPYLYSTTKDKEALRCVYADNSYMEEPPMWFLAILADVYSDPIATWLGYHFGSCKPISWLCDNLLSGHTPIYSRSVVEDATSWMCDNWAWGIAHFHSSQAPTPDKSAIDRLPLVRAFENGENFIRSSWEPDSIVLSLYTAGLPRTRYAHQRPERNSINLGAYGEYLIVSPHAASYRSVLYYDYDRSTLSANSIRIDDKDQFLPQRNTMPWGEVPPYANYGEPIAKLAHIESNSDFDVLIGDARLCYQEPLSEASRTVVYHRSKNYFIVIDRMVDAEKQAHNYTMLWHFNNLDHKLKLSEIDNPDLLVDRPRANLAIFTGASCDLVRTLTDGYMHKPTRDYSPKGPYEGTLGSAKVLNVSNSTPTSAVTFITVLQPLRKNDVALPTSWKDGKITVGDNVWILDDNSIQFGQHQVSLKP